MEAKGSFKRPRCFLCSGPSWFLMAHGPLLAPGSRDEPQCPASGHAPSMPRCTGGGCGALRQRCTSWLHSQGAASASPRTRPRV